ncbi:MAG: XRE family transcriptional regulator [Clostridia bacterium]|nr:XRE family transcriptional regulator [Clostridia bacterium]
MNDYTKKFAENVKRLRKAHNITQKELADKIGYSEKAVSKWECAASVPDVEALFTLSRHFNVRIDDLFKDSSEIYFLGIDGGGTKTAFALADKTGKVLRTHECEGCNPMDIGIDASKKILADGIYAITEGIALSSVVLFAGIAGGGSPHMHAALGEHFASLGFAASWNDSDNANIIAAGIGNDDGIAMITGTGIFAMAQIGGERSRVAGWGYLIDNGGSAYNVGRDGLNAYYCALDGSAPKTALTEAIDTHTGMTPQQLLGAIYAGGKRKIASFAPLVYKTARAGDKVAADIVEKNIAAIALVVETAGKRFQKTPIRVVFAGGLTKEPDFLESVQKHLSEPERFDLARIPCSPVEGAVRLAMEKWEQYNTPQKEKQYAKN